MKSVHPLQSSEVKNRRIKNFILFEVGWQTWLSKWRIYKLVLSGSHMQGKSWLPFSGHYYKCRTATMNFSGEIVTYFVSDYIYRVFHSILYPRWINVLFFIKYSLFYLKCLFRIKFSQVNCNVYFFKNSFFQKQNSKHF